MKEIISVTGKLDPKDLGFCQCHEHIAISKGKSFDVNPVLCIDDMQKSLEEIRRYRSVGGTSLIDAQPCGCNRMSEELRMLSRLSGVNIIASTGFHKMEYYTEEHWIHTISAEELEEIFVRELTEGMYADADWKIPSKICNAKAGVIKTALDTEELSDRYRRLFLAAAKAALRTERTIMVHVEQGADPLLLQKYFLNMGVKAKDIIFCHMDRACKDLKMHKHILKQGSYLEFDTIGRFKYHSDEEEIRIFKELIRSGYEKQLLYSLDTTRARLKSYNETAVGLDYILVTFNEAMKNAGVSERVLREIAIENPVRLLTQ